MQPRDPSASPGVVEAASILDALPVGITVQDRAGKIVYANEAGAGLLGFRNGPETAGATSSEILSRFEFVTEEGSALAVEDLPGRRALRGEEAGSVVLRVRDLVSGEESWRTATAIPILDEKGEVVYAVNVFRDVTREKLAEHHLAAQYAVSEVLADAPSFEDATPRLLEAICRSLRWDVGMLWWLDPADEVLRRREAWHGGDPKLQGFVDRSAALLLPPGTGWPGRIVKTRAPGWVHDVRQEPDFRRKREAVEADLIGACAIPVLRDEEVLGVMEFFTQKVRIPDPEFVWALGALAGHIELFVLRQEAQEGQRYLVEASEVLAGSIDYEETLRAVATTAVPRLADICLVYLLDEETGEIARVAMEGLPEALAEALPLRFPIDPQGPQGVPKVIRTGRRELRPEADAALLSADVHDSEGLRRALEPLGIRSWMCLPLTARGRTFGAISFISSVSGRRFDEEAFALAQYVVHQAAIRVDNALLYRDAEEAQRRLAFLAEASRVMSGSLNYDRTLSRVADLTVPQLADWCVVDVLQEDGSLEEVAIAHVDPAKVERVRELRRRYPSDPEASQGLWKVIRTGEPQLIPEITDEFLALAARDEEHLRLLRELGMRSALIVPLIARNRTLGTLSLVATGSGRRYTQHDVSLASDLARRAAVAVENARLFRERSRIAMTLQRSLLPPALPTIEGIELTARYRPAEEGVDIGGDFYDIFPVGDEEWAVVIGDVCGKGVEAAALTGLARQSIRATVRQGQDGLTALGVLNEEMRSRSSAADFCTLAYARLRPDTDRVEATVVCAGHPPPLVLRASGEVERAGTPGTLLGVIPDLELNPRTVTLMPGDALFMYTDGLVEGLAGDEAAEALLRGFLAGAAGEGVEGIAAAVDSAVSDRASGARDDSAFVIARVTGPEADPSV